MIDLNNVYSKKIGEITLFLVKAAKAHNNNWKLLLVAENDVLLKRDLSKKGATFEVLNEKKYAHYHNDKHAIDFFLAINKIGSLGIKNIGKIARSEYVKTTVSCEMLKNLLDM